MNLRVDAVSPRDFIADTIARKVNALTGRVMTIAVQHAGAPMCHNRSVAMDLHALGEFLKAVVHAEFGADTICPVAVIGLSGDLRCNLVIREGHRLLVHLPPINPSTRIRSRWR